MKIDTSSAMLASIATARSRMLEPGSDASHGGSGTGFAAAMKQAIDRIDAREHDANDKVAAVDSGESDDLVGAMLASQEAQLSFSMLLQARNRLMGAFDDIIKLQV